MKTATRRTSREGDLTLFPAQPPTVEVLASQLVEELRRSGRLRGIGGVLLLEENAIGASVAAVVKIGKRPVRT